MSNKLTLSIFLISFWLLVPIPMQFMGLGNFEEWDAALVEVEEPTLLTYLTVAFSIITTYFYLLIIGIPQAPLFINILLFIMRLTSGLIIYLLLRGD